MFVTKYESLAGGILAVIGILTALIGVGRKIARRVSDFLDDWNGEPSRPGVPAQPGVMERIRNLDDGQLNIIDRLKRVEHEVLPNSGTSLNDKVTRIDQAMTGGPDAH